MSDVAQPTTSKELTDAEYVRLVSVTHPGHDVFADYHAAIANGTVADRLHEGERSLLAHLETLAPAELDAVRAQVERRRSSGAVPESGSRQADAAGGLECAV